MKACVSTVERKFRQVSPNSYVDIDDAAIEAEERWDSFHAFVFNHEISMVGGVSEAAMLTLGECVKIICLGGGTGLSKLGHTLSRLSIFQRRSSRLFVVH